MIDVPYGTFGFLINAGKKARHKQARQEKRTFAESDRTFIGGNDERHILKDNDILCIKSECDNSTIYLRPGIRIIVRSVIKQREKQLPGSIFLRIHRSTIVNINHVERIGKSLKRSHIPYLRDLQENLTMSQRYLARFKSGS